MNFIQPPRGDALTDQAFLQSALQQQSERDAHSLAVMVSVGSIAVAIAIVITFVVLRRYRRKTLPKAE